MEQSFAAVDPRENGEAFGKLDDAGERHAAALQPLAIEPGDLRLELQPLGGEQKLWRRSGTAQAQFMTKLLGICCLAVEPGDERQTCQASVLPR